MTKKKERLKRRKGFSGRAATFQNSGIDFQGIWRLITKFLQESRKQKKDCKLHDEECNPF